eukprot:TRINITY_DN31127_c0_g1_i1.p1 TRINITY_DN31127_c0_g1~~TRINITY_DN31127_c0_g1_i1.p1  ORF type:complete len:120 (-),score=0.21 TRINITY_DN31127_c0_g1_i1:1007-1366(-)
MYETTNLMNEPLTMINCLFSADCPLCHNLFFRTQWKYKFTDFTSTSISFKIWKEFLGSFICATRHVTLFAKPISIIPGLYACNIMILSSALTVKISALSKSPIQAGSGKDMIVYTNSFF